MAGLVFDPSLLTVWRAIQSGDLPGGAFPVTSVFARTGDVVAVTGDYYGVVSAALTGATQASRYVGSTTSGAPASGTFAVGDFVVARDGHLFVCTTAGSPGTWADVGASSGVSSLDSITGAVTLVGGTNISVTDNSPSAGDITIATSGGSGLVNLYESTLGSDTASIDTGAGGIASGHGDLIIYITVRTAVAAATDSLIMRVNNNSSGLYYSSRVQVNNTTVTGATSTAQTSWLETCHGDGAAGNLASAFRIDIPAYDQTTFGKTGLLHSYTFDGTTANNFEASRGIGYNSASAISQFAISATSTSNLKTGSRLVVYGTQ